MQGVEATYLAKKAGWEVTLFDKRKNAQASTLADTFHCINILTSPDAFLSRVKGHDFILPAIEDQEVLEFLLEAAEKTGIPLAFDRKAYELTSSKRRSNAFFQELDIPVPMPWPHCSFPLIVKPSGESGSVGVQTVTNIKELDRLLEQKNREDWVVEEYLEGPSYSIEVFGFNGEFRVFPITELEMDESYDCKRVFSPAELNYSLIDELEELALKLARELNLTGIMDVETILHKGKLKVLEIDARLPSQTPTAIFHSSGINMVECIGYSFTQGKLYIPIPRRPSPADRYAIYEHFKISEKKIAAGGEHLIAGAGPLHLLTDFFGAEEALTDYTPGKKNWVLTLITRGSTRAEAWMKRNLVIRRIQEEFNIPHFVDPYPQSLGK